MSLLNHRIISERYFFPRKTRPTNATLVPFSDGSGNLACWQSDSSSNRPILIHFHGNGEIVSDWMHGFPERISAFGLDVFLAEYRGYGGSDGSPTLEDMLDDVKEIAKAVDRSPSEVIVFGRSVGSIFAIEWIRRFPETKGLILESGIHDVYERLRLRMRPSELGCSELEFVQTVQNRMNHQKVLSEYAGKSLILHAENDHLVHKSHAERNAEAAQNASLVLFPQGDHNSILYYNQDEYFRQIGEFLKL